MNRRRHTALGCLLCISAVALAVPVSAGPGAGGKTKGFVVTRLVVAMYEGKTGRTADWNASDGRPECPEGFNVGPDREAVLAKLPPAERARLRRPENASLGGEAFWLERHRGRFNMDVCDHPKSVPDPGFKVVQGKTAYGLDLDGSDGKAPGKHSCPHENFVGPNGEPGIDNQLYRLFGCMKGFRQGGMMYDYFNALMRQGDFTVLIEIGDVDDLKNDDSVTVGIYAGQDPMVNNENGVSLTNASISVHYDRNYHSLTSGKIVNGILTTVPVNVEFKSPPEKLHHYFRDARLQVELLPDGTLKGILAGYQEVRNVYKDVTAFAAAESTIHGPMTCPGFGYAIQRLADGYSDAGQCAWISSAYELDAVPAFVIHPREDNPVNAKAAEPEEWWRKLIWWR